MSGNFLVYKLTRSDGLEYIGTTNDLNRRLARHAKSRRFGDQPIVCVQILSFRLNQDRALEEETRFIDRYNTFNAGLNNTPDGSGNQHAHGKLNTKGMSYVKGKIWCNNGVSNTVCDQNHIPCGYVKGKIGTKGRVTSEATKRLFSEQRKGKVRYTKFTSDKIEQMLELYKSRPKLDDEGHAFDASKSMIRTYERAFARQYSEMFGMTAANLWRILHNQGGVAWGEVWKKVFES